jgi:23S rRNA pseudouridine1911/1915/1917 synthase
MIVHEDDDLIVVDKPAGLVVHPAPSHRGQTLVDLLGDRVGGGEEGRPGIVHRLDKDTSGLLIVARNEGSHRALSAQIRSREVERVYLALVEGRMESRSGTIDAPIGRDPRRRTRMAVAGRAAREARTHFEVQEALPRHTLLEVRLETGRTHQIRSHLAAIGHPLAGDARYGGEPLGDLRRQFLHSHRLRFRHPVSGEEIRAESGLPTDLEEALGLARGG